MIMGHQSAGTLETAHDSIEVTFQLHFPQAAPNEYREWNAVVTGPVERLLAAMGEPCTLHETLRHGPRPVGEVLVAAVEAQQGEMTGQATCIGVGEPAIAREWREFLEQRR